MLKYKSDRTFTDYIHKHLAMPIIYKPLLWQKVQLKADYASYIDMTDGIDYIFRKEDTIFTVQERFRDERYKEYSDFTIRYRRDQNKEEERHKSEYYKMKAHYFTYGIINRSKSAYTEASDFLKFAIIDLKKVYEKLDSKEIFITNNGDNLCRIAEENKIECPIQYNIDGSSSFFPIDISFLVKLWGDDMVIYQKGFL